MTAVNFGHVDEGAEAVNKELKKAVMKAKWFIIGSRS